MAKDSSFDIVSQVDMQEVDNAVQQAAREISQRYDLKDTASTVSLDNTAATVSIAAPADFVARQIIDILGSKFVKRQIDLKAIIWGDPESASGGTIRILGTVINGIDQDIAKNINKDIKDQKFKAKVQIEGDKLRVSSPKRDTLQEIIAFVKDHDYGIPIQFINYR